MTEDSYRGEIMKPEIGHLYVYCANNPVNYVDPSGHFAIAVPVFGKVSTCGRNSNFMYLILHGKIIVRRQDMMEEGFSYRSTIFQMDCSKSY